MKEIISIVIPIYNAEKYLIRCLESIINQSYNELEILLINDGSIDSSREICEEYCKKDLRIKLINQENQGVSKARNIGISNSTGKYICFVDADDWVDKRFCQRLLQNMINDKSQLSVCGVVKASKTFIYNQEKKENKVLNKQEAYYNMATNSNFSGYLANKLYLKKLLIQIGIKPLDESIHYCEDFLLNSVYLKKCNKISYTEEKLYYYYISNSSATQCKKINKRLFTMIDSYKKILEIYDEISEENYDYVLYAYIKAKLNINYRCKKAHMLLPYKLKDNEEKRRLISSKKITTFKKLYLLISIKWPIMSSWIKYLFLNLRTKCEIKNIKNDN